MEGIAAPVSKTIVSDERTNRARRILGFLSNSEKLLSILFDRNEIANGIAGIRMQKAIRASLKIFLASEKIKNEEKIPAAAAAQVKI